jgi:hypothetical protein
MLKFISISFFIINVLFVLVYDGTVEGAEINVVFRGTVIDIPLGASDSTLNDAEVYDAELGSFLSAYGVLSIEKLIPGFESKDTLGVTRTGEIVRLRMKRVQTLFLPIPENLNGSRRPKDLNVSACVFQVRPQNPTVFPHTLVRMILCGHSSGICMVNGEFDCQKHGTGCRV